MYWCDHCYETKETPRVLFPGEMELPKAIRHFSEVCPDCGRELKPLKDEMDDMDE